MRADDDVLLISTQGSGDPVPADDEQLRPMGRATSGVTGMKFRAGDELLSMSIIRAGVARSTATCSRSPTAGSPSVPRWRNTAHQGRGGLGIKAMKLADDRGSLVGGMVVNASDEVIAIKASGQVTRSGGSVPVKGRDTMGVKFVTVGSSDSVVAIARNTEREVDELVEELVGSSDDPAQPDDISQETEMPDIMQADEDNPATDSLPDEQEDDADE